MSIACQKCEVVSNHSKWLVIFPPQRGKFQCPSG